MAPPDLFHQLVLDSAQANPAATAVTHKGQVSSYGQVASDVLALSSGLQDIGIESFGRIAVYLPKQLETVVSLFAVSAAGGAFVPINPVLKAKQVAYILRNCNVRILVTSHQRLQALEQVLAACADLRVVVLVDSPDTAETSLPQAIISYADLLGSRGTVQPRRRIDADIAAIMYTSGSTGSPKGVVLSHRNLVAGANSVASYLQNVASDRILAVLPLSFDAGLSQLTTAFSVGASVVLLDYLLPRDVVRTVGQHGVTGITAVPPLWNQLVNLEWPEEARTSLRYISNTGGAMPVATTRSLQKQLPNTDIYLMYGLTEAFRSTFLPPDQVTARPDSIGKAIPNAEVLVVNELGELCAPGEPGELVHRGALVAMGYWNDPERTAERFKPCPGRDQALPITELAVWSGDQVVTDDEGYLYFVSRKDDMIKTSGYRVSPSEIEEVVYGSGRVAGAVALGLAHPTLGQAVLLAVSHQEGDHQPAELERDLLKHCREELPQYMVPLAVVVRESLPHNPNGKIDRRALVEEYADVFMETQR